MEKVKTDKMLIKCRRVFNVEKNVHESRANKRD